MKQMESQKEVCELLKRELDFPDDFEGGLDELYAELLGMEENTCVEMIQPEAGSPLESFGKEMESGFQRGQNVCSICRLRIHSEDSLVAWNRT